MNKPRHCNVFLANVTEFNEVSYEDIHKIRTLKIGTFLRPPHERFFYRENGNFYVE